MFSRHIKRVIRARNYTNANRKDADIEVVVIHTMESPEDLTTAESVSNWAAGPTAPRASWHYATDADSIVGCVEEEDVAWAAPGCNHNGIQIELAGRAGQTKAQWRDRYSARELDLTAKLVADICKRRNIPVRHLTDAELRAGKRGIVGHDQVTRVFKQSSHWDPGPNFPWGEFIRDVDALVVPHFRFVLRDGEGKDLARSGPFERRDALSVWGSFSKNALDERAVNELLADGDIAIRLVRA